MSTFARTIAAMVDNPGYTIRLATPEDAQGLTRVHVRSWQSSYRGLLPQEFLDNIDSTERLGIWRRTLARPEAYGVFVAVAPGTGELVGFCGGGQNQSGPDEYPGEIYSIYLLDEAKGLGVGRALLERCTQWLREHSLTPISLWVLSDNTRARGFYERMGGQLVGEQTIMIGGVRYPEVAYGWGTPQARKAPKPP